MGKNLSLQKKAVCAIIFLTLVLAAISAMVSYRVYTHNMAGHYKSMCRNVAWTASSVVEGIELERYVARVSDIYLQNPLSEFEGKEEAAYLEQYDSVKDEGYWKIYHTFEKIKNANGAHALYVIYIDIPSKTYVYVMDIGDAESAYPVGTWGHIASEDYGVLENPRQGFPGTVVETKEAGWLCRAGVPVIRADGTVAAFVMAALPMNSGVKDRWEYMVKSSLILTAIAMTIGIVSVRILTRLWAQAQEPAEQEVNIHDLAMVSGEECLETQEQEDVS